jgi:hypothetical protein
MTSTLIHIHASTTNPPTVLPSNSEWFKRNADYWVGETLQTAEEGSNKQIRFCWTKKEERANRQLYSSIKHQIFMMTVVPLAKKSNSFDYNGFVVISDKEEIYHPNYIILSNEDDTDLLEGELDYYDDKIEGDSNGIYIDLNDLNKLTTWYDDRVLF